METDVELEMAASREWLVRLCARLSGRPDAAEDLAQETLVEAWRAAGRRSSPEHLRPWLAGIARNVVRRWRRSEARHAGMAPDRDWALESVPAGKEADPERRYLDRELSATLSAGLELVPAASRDALLAACLEERPQAEVAEALGIAEPAVSARVYRGKRALRAAFTQPGLRDALMAFGFGFGPEPAAADPWRATAIRCPLCGIHTLRFRFDETTNLLSVRCAGACLPNHDGCIIGGMTILPESRRLTSPKAILTHHLIDAYACYRQMLADRGRACHRCGRFIPVELGSPASAYAAGVYLRCPECDFFDDTSLWHLTLDHPATQAFWRRHPRMHALPITEIAYDGAPAVLTGFASRDAAATIEVLYSPDRYDVLRIETIGG